MSSGISVVVPVRNCERYLGETLESILGQTLPPDEVLVVDDGSTDHTAEVAHAFGPPVTVISQSPQGPSAARNVGIAAAGNALIALCDADDLWLPEKLELQRSLIDDVGEPVAVFCTVSEFVTDESGQILDDPSDVIASRKLRAPVERAEGARYISALLATRAAFEATGPFRSNTTVEWPEWSMRLSTSGVRVRFHPELLVRRRMHVTSRSADPAGRGADLVDAIAQHLARRRRTPG
jgi:glycosyltransferase involved in cell wall biosynthesis